MGENSKTGGKYTMDTKKVNIQDTVLNHLRKSKVPCSIFLVNGVKLNATIKGFDNFVLVVDDGSVKMVYKHAISTIAPTQAMDDSFQNLIDSDSKPKK